MPNQKGFDLAQPKLKSLVQEAQQPLVRLVLWATEASGPFAEIACIGRETQACYIIVSTKRTYGDAAAIGDGTQDLRSSSIAGSC